jgi:methenyltetrahydrofolate cyclohydrolase
VEERDVQAQTVGGWLDDLASAASTPGGGAAAAMDAAVGAALLCMVCNLTVGKPKYAEHEQTMTSVLARAQELRRQAIGLADADAHAFDAVVAAYRLPKDTDAERQARSEAIQAGLVGAADVPLQTAALAAEVIELAERIVDGANVNVLSDVAVAAASARAALDAAAINVEVNLATMTDAQRRGDLAGRLAAYTPATARAETVVQAVRARISR